LTIPRHTLFEKRMTGDSSNTKRSPHFHTHPNGLVWRDLIEDYYTRFIEIWQTSKSIDEAHHRVLDTLDPGLSERTSFTGRAHYLKMMGVKLKDLKPHCIDWDAMNTFARSLEQ